jgi:hypothetical protein
MDRSLVQVSFLALEPSNHIRASFWFQTLKFLIIHQIFRGIKCFVIENAGVFLTLLLRSMQRVKKLDKFEKMV